MYRRSNDNTPEWLKNKRDENEPGIVEMIQRLGGAWRACSRHEGHDGWVAWGSLWLCAEVKNPAHHWKLTRAERVMQIWCINNGVEYYILQYPEDVQRMFDDAERRIKNNFSLR
jgi:hypothetical protein